MWFVWGFEEKKENTILCILSSDIRRPFLFSTARRLIVVKYNEVSWDFTYYRELWLFMRLEKHLLLPLKKGFLGSSRRSRRTRQRRSSERVKYFCSLGGTLLVCSIFQGGLERLDRLSIAAKTSQESVFQKSGEFLPDCPTWSTSVWSHSFDQWHHHKWRLYLHSGHTVKSALTGYTTRVSLFWCQFLKLNVKFP